MTKPKPEAPLHVPAPSPLEYIHTENLVADACTIIDIARRVVQRAVNWTLVQRNWLLGQRIAEEELKDVQRAEYGAKVIRTLAEELTAIYGTGKGFDYSSLYKYLRFFKAFPRIVDAARPQFYNLLTWTHYRMLLEVSDPAAREWYAMEAASQAWNYRTLQRNIATQYYYRLLKAPNPDAVEAEMRQKTRSLQSEANLEFVKSPVIAEFLGMQPDTSFLETDLETCILSNLQRFMMELGKGYAFVERQKRIVTEVRDYFIDLVFYNFILKCFVLIDLKTDIITPQDVGQMDMYLRMFDEKFRQTDDRPTLGLILCAETDQDVMRYSILQDNNRLYASKYLLCLPTQEQLRAEIEHQKTLFYLQHGNDQGDDSRTNPSKSSTSFPK